MVDKGTARDARHAPAGRHPENRLPVPASVPPEFDRLIHERIRLAIVSALAASDWLSFQDLKRLLGTSDGNLSVHARKLEEAGYIGVRKFFEGRMPRTEYRLLAPGRRALDQYLERMEEFVRAARSR